jgi:nucleotide-binding universal stress UspA family protein
MLACPAQADELNAALVVMAAHHKGRLLKYLVGSVTKYTVNKCNQTVLVMH